MARKPRFWGIRTALVAIGEAARQVRQSKANKLRDDQIHLKLEALSIKNAREKEKNKQETLKTRNLILKNQLLQAQIAETQQLAPENTSKAAVKPPKNHPNGIPASFCPACNKNFAITYTICPECKGKLTKIKI